jgi:putative membrane protein
MKLNFILGLLLGAGLLVAQPPGGGAPPSGGGAPGGAPPMSSPTPQPGMNNPDNVPSTPTTKVDDKKFAQEAAKGNLEEVQLAKLAQQKASSDAVKQFAQKMIDDHTKANEQLQQLASRDSLTVPDRLDSKQQDTVNKLSQLSGPAFDKAYAKNMVKDHKKDVQAFRAESQLGTQANVKQFASQTLPVLQQHLELAKNLDKTVKKESK